jgi:predicted ATPase
LLRQIEVSGFKSLENFSLEFHKGLNVIVGPNGSGKTNILSFLEFLSHTARNRLLDAVSRSGGAGRIFRRNKTGTLGRALTFTIRGEGQHVDYMTSRAVMVYYEYSAEVQLREASGSLSYSSQCLRLSSESQPPGSDWPVSVEVAANENEEVKIHLARSTAKHFQDQYVRRQAADPSELRSAIEEIIRRSCLNTPLFHVLERYLLGAGLIIRDLNGAKSFNISPSAVRKAEDIAGEPQIEEDGSGLAAVLFALTTSRHGAEDYWDDFRYGPYRFPQPDETFTKIISYSKIVSDAIEDITVEPDTIENQLRIFVKVDYGQSSLKLPFSLVSDGTAKWFTLVTAIVTSKAVFAIEEPENFLHPLMQKEIVRIVREEFKSGEKDAFAVMTTHSETILNCVDPDELILVHMEEGRSVAKRSSNAADVRAEINRTGFGAGYYYLAGAIE